MYEQKGRKFHGRSKWLLESEDLQLEWVFNLGVCTMEDRQLPPSGQGIMFDLEANSGGCKAAIAAGTPGVCAATSGTDYGTTPSAELFQLGPKRSKALGARTSFMPFCLKSIYDVVCFCFFFFFFGLAFLFSFAGVFFC